ncbi:HAD family hydrolase [Bacillus kwashiorkori]|uniref:HAD family hydrolase n=1 Tax=Bacillus kwashiorkori TaxID=1522318 RepID=UPI0007860A62|nr:HAD family hydrolase [Bacillus kwashiorkori]
MKKGWITFDLDGTLMQNPFSKWVFPEIERKVKEKKPSAEVVKALVTEHYRRMGKKEFVAAYDWQNMLDEFLINEGINIEINIAKLVRTFATPSKVYLLERIIPEVLKKLKVDNFLVAAVTNGFYDYQIPVMETLEIDYLFDEIITPDHVGYAKPDVGIFRTLLKKGNVLMHVGDRIDHDVMLANEFGSISIWINKDLPKNLQSIKPVQRMQTYDGQLLSAKKWKEEIKQQEMVLNRNIVENRLASEDSKQKERTERNGPELIAELKKANGLPDHIIHSTSEILSIVQEWGQSPTASPR